MRVKARQRMLTSSQIEEARLLLGWSTSDLAKRSGISVSAAYRIEKPESLVKTRMTTLSAVRTTFEAAGVIFSDDGIRIKSV